MKYEIKAYPVGATLTGTARHGLERPLVLEDSECLTEAGSCSEDMWMYHWRTPDDNPFLTTDIELAGYLADGATLSY
jgi:hypothetical protein